MLTWLLAALPAIASGPALRLPLTRLQDATVFDALLSYPPIKSLLPIPILIAIAPIIIWFFRRTWRELDAEALEYRLSVCTSSGSIAAAPRPHRRRWRPRNRPLHHGPSRSRPGCGRPRRRRIHVGPTPPRIEQRRPSRLAVYQRPAACLAITAVILTIHEYYGGRQFYATAIQPWLQSLEANGSQWVYLKQWDELYGYGWWVLARVVGYVVIPFPVWKLLFPRDSLLDMGLRTRDFIRHAWVYGLCLAVVLPLLLLVSRQPDFASYYPFYKNCSRSWLDFGIWECMYCLQFLALEMFFRGWMVGALRKTMGAGAIFAMAVPYCMIHYGKPYLEAHGAIVAGIVLGSLAMRTKSIYSGFLVHITVAIGMDLLALVKGDGLPTDWLPMP